MRLNPRGGGTDCKCEFERIDTFLILEMVVLYEYLEEGFVEVFVVGGIFEDAGGDAVEEGKVCCGIFLGGCFSAMTDMLAELFSKTAC
jgi:hypothetical protein